MGRRNVRQLTTLRTPVAFVEDGFTDADGATGIIFRPGTPSSTGNIVATWAEVQAAIAATNGALNVFVDSSIAPAVVDVGVTDFQGRVFLRAASTVLTPAPMQLDVPDGAVLQDLAGILFSLLVVLHGTTGPTLKFTKAVSFGVFGGAVLDNQGTVPAIEVDPTLPILVLSAIVGGRMSATGAPIVNVPNPGQQLILTEFTAAAMTGASFATGPVGAGLQIIFDASIQSLPSTPGWLGGIGLSPLDQAVHMQYQPAILANWSGVQPTSVADALDRIAAKIGPIP
jgi:hypothetical protein